MVEIEDTDFKQVVKEACWVYSRIEELINDMRGQGHMTKLPQISDIVHAMVGIQSNVLNILQHVPLADRERLSV